MFSYKINESHRGPIIQIFSGATLIDECGPWESNASAIQWASSYVNFKQSGEMEPVLPSETQSTIEDESSSQFESEV